MNRTIRCFVTGLLVINALLFSGCGSDSGSNEKTQSTGDISLGLVWNSTSSGKAPLTRSALDVVLDQEGRIDCDASGINTIYVRIYDQTSGELVKDNGEGWQCSDHSGAIQNVSIGNRKLVCLAYDDLGNVIYRGQQLDVTVSAAETSSVQVAMESFASEPSGLDDGARTSENALEIQCTPVSNAAQYRLQVATGNNFDEIILDETSPTPDFTSSPLSTSNTYYWRICAVDAHGSQGAWSTTRTVEVTLPPVVSTDPAANVSPSAAVLNGTVNSRGLATTCYFQYGPTTDYGTRTETVDAGEIAEAVAVTAQLEGIDSETTYHFRLVAENSAGPVIGEDRTFATGDVTEPYIEETEPANGAAI